ncbi:MAG: leucyl aminopeptidase [Chloroflexi bacterium]|nr:MAG: leucyl aminopeptidase [Chloroflexota bacterium]TME43370.1 MAG: leucyl aminopeptidase [Chloroflexota bacterium]
MKFRAARPAAIGTVDAIVVPLASDTGAPSGLPRGVRTIVDRIAKTETGASRVYGVTTHQGEPKIVVVGMGKASELDAERARNVAAAGIKSLWRSTAKRVAIVVPGGALSEERATAAAVEGAVYAMWRPEAHRTREEERRLPPIDTITLVTAKPQSAAIARGQVIGEAVNAQRRLANEPANKMTPTLLADEARALAKQSGVQIEVLDRAKCKSLAMGSYLSVAQGSHEEPRFIVMRYRGRGGKGYDVGFVGKGITFDSGGISIKPADNMHHMKADMTGAASVIAAISAIGKLKPKVNVIAVAPCTENLPGGGATKPGDVFTSMSGKTVEVINTDAEGRLVLIDGLTYAQREGATRVVDVATLTGAIAVALGPYFVGLFGKPRAFVDTVQRVAGEAGDRVWPMPLTAEYRDEIKGEVADIRNSAGREGGAIKAAAFLESVIEDGTEWAHLDIAGVDWSDRDRPYAPRGPQGPSVRTLVALAESLAAS